MWNDLIVDVLLPDNTEQTIRFADLCGKKTVLYFYPKDNTLGCTKEACDFRDNINRLSAKIKLIAVSPDSLKKHRSFKDRRELNFPLIADTQHMLAEAFGVWKEKSMYGLKYMGIERSTFILDESGNIIHEWRKVKVSGHVDEVLNFLDKLEK